MEELAVKESKYRAVHVAARRARQLQSGSSPIVPTRSTKAVRIAQDEMQAGLIDYIVPEGPSRKELGLPTGYTPILHVSTRCIPSLGASRERVQSEP